jgi:hypothetical protein
VNLTLTGTNFVPGGTFVGAGGTGVGVSAVNVTSPIIADGDIDGRCGYESRRS